MIKTAFIAFLAVGALVYGPSVVRNGFVYDDRATIVENSFIKHPGNLPKLLNPRAYLSTRAQSENFDRNKNIGSGEATYRPITTLSYFFLYACFGLNPAGYHAASVLWHVLNACLVFLLLRKISRQDGAAFLGALIFLTHPALSEAVYGISYNEDLLATFFSLAAFLAWLEALPLAAIAPLYLAACFTKESALLLPLLFLAYGLFVGNDKRLFNARNAIGLALAALFYVLVRWVIFANPAAGIDYSRGCLWALPKALLGYLGWCVWPATARPTLPHDPWLLKASIKDAWVWVSLMAIPYLSWAAWRLRRSAPSVLFGWIWFWVMLAPVFPLTVILMSPRYLYFPLIGVLLMALPFLSRIAKKGCVLIGVVLIPILGFQTFLAGLEWKNGLTLFGALANRRPDSALAQRWYAAHLADHGAWQAAAERYAQSLKIEADSEQALIGLADSLSAMSRFDQADQRYAEAARLWPRSARVFLNWGMSLGRRGEKDRALEMLHRAESLEPQAADIQDALGVTYANQGQMVLAASAWKKALFLEPDRPSAKANLDRLPKNS